MTIPTVSRSRRPALDRNLRVRLVVAFAQRLLDSMVMTYIAIAIASAYGVALAGVLVAAVMVLGVVATFIGGHLSDVFGRRSTLICGESLVTVTFAVMALANAHGMPGLLYAAYACNKLGSGIATPANDAMIVDVTTRETRQRAYTLNYWSINLGLSLGALIGGFLYRGHFTLLLAIAAAGMAGALLTTVVLLTETAPKGTLTRDVTDPGSRPGQSVAGRVVGAYGGVLRDLTFRRLLIAATLTMTVEFQLVYYVAVHLAANLSVQSLLHVGRVRVSVDGVRMLGVLRAENTVLVVLMAAVAAAAFGRLAPGTRVKLGIVLFIGGYMVLPVATSAVVLIVAMLVVTVGELLNVPVKQAMLADCVPEKSRAKYMAMYAMNIRVGLVLASLLMVVGQWVGPWGMSSLYGILGVIALRQYSAILAPRGVESADVPALKSLPS